jgi:hypothetical protein
MQLYSSKLGLVGELKNWRFSQKKIKEVKMNLEKKRKSHTYFYHKANRAVPSQVLWNVIQ